MALNPKHLVAAGALAGAVVLGGATWASAQDSSTTDDPTTTEQRDGGRRPEDRAPRDAHRSGDCEHGERRGGGDASTDGDDVEASALRA